MPSRMSATHLARHLSEVLDAVEHRGESFTIERHGKPVARIEAPRLSSLRAPAEAIEREPRLDEDLEHDVRDALSVLADEPRDRWRD